MTPTEQAAVAASLDAAAQSLLGWAVVLFTIGYFGRKLYLRLVSSVSPAAPAEIMSPERPSEPSEPSRPEDGRPIAPPAPVIFTPTHAQTFDAAKLMRGFGLNREQAREVLKAMGGALPNDMWTQVAPPPTEGQTVTPIAQRLTKAKFEYDDPALNYAEPTT